MKSLIILLVGVAMLTLSACSTCPMGGKKKDSACCASDSSSAPSKDCCASGHAGHSHGKAKKTN